MFFQGKSNLFKWLAALVTVVLLFGLVFSIQFTRFAEEGLNLKTDSVSYVLPLGASLGVVSQDLHQLGVISSPVMFRWYLRYSHLDTQIKAGEYAFGADMSVGDVIKKITKGEVVQHAFTIIPGTSIHRLFDSLQQSPYIESTIPKMSVAKVYEALGVLSSHTESLNSQSNSYEIEPFFELEGMFYPDTYFVAKGTKDLDILKLAFTKMQEELKSLFENRDRSVDDVIKSPRDVITLASMVELESSKSCDAKAVASVLINRLRIRMPLQSDPTAVYVLAGRFEGPITPEHLKSDNPYNTYVNYGLPKGPVAIPSKNAIEAVLHPMDTSLLYFVAKGDGSHYFSSTYEEHKHAIDRFRKGKSNDKPSEPKP